MPGSNRDGSILDDATSMIGRFMNGVAGRNDPKRRTQMSVAKVSEISSTSANSFEDAIQQGLKRAGKTIRNIRSAWIKEQHVRLDKGKITEYQVNMMVTFVVDD